MALKFVHDLGFQLTVRQDNTTYDLTDYVLKSIKTFRGRKQSAQEFGFSVAGSLTTTIYNPPVGDDLSYADGGIWDFLNPGATIQLRISDSQGIYIPVYDTNIIPTYGTDAVVPVYGGVQAGQAIWTGILDQPKRHTEENYQEFRLRAYGLLALLDNDVSVKRQSNINLGAAFIRLMDAADVEATIFYRSDIDQVLIKEWYVNDSNALSEARKLETTTGGGLLKERPEGQLELEHRTKRLLPDTPTLVFPDQQLFFELDEDIDLSSIERGYNGSLKTARRDTDKSVIWSAEVGDPGFPIVLAAGESETLWIDNPSSVVDVDYDTIGMDDYTSTGNIEFELSTDIAGGLGVTVKSSSGGELTSLKLNGYKWTEVELAGVRYPGLDGTSKRIPDNFIPDRARLFGYLTLLSQINKPGIRRLTLKRDIVGLDDIIDSTAIDTSDVVTVRWQHIKRNYFVEAVRYDVNGIESCTQTLELVNAGGWKSIARYDVDSYDTDKVYA